MRFSEMETEMENFVQHRRHQATKAMKILHKKIYDFLIFNERKPLNKTYYP